MPADVKAPSAAAKVEVIPSPMPTAVPTASAATKVEDLIGSFRGPGSVRRQAADYAVALMAHERLPEAPHLLDDALANAGAEPSDALLLLLRGHCRQSIGQPGPALQDLLASTEADPTLLPSAAPRLQRLLLSAEAGESRARIVKSWGPDLEQRVSVDDHLLVCVIELQAAVLQHDARLADKVVHRIRRAHAEAGVVQCAEMLAWARGRAPADGRLFEALARTEVSLGLAGDAIADIDRAIQLGLGEPGAGAALLEFKAGILAGHGEDAQALSVLREAGESAYFENDSQTAVRLLREVWMKEADADTGWHLADALRICAAQPTASQVSMLREALQVANRAAVLPPRSGQLAWWHSVLAQIHLDLAALEPLAGTHHLIIGALEDERRLLLEEDMATLAQLAQCYRALSWNALTADAATQCRGPLEDRPDVLLCLASAQLESGRDARDTLEALLRHPQTPELIRPLIYYILGQNEEALAAFRGQLEKLKDEPVSRQLYVRLLRDLDQQAAVAAELEALRHQAESLPEWKLSGPDRAFTYYLLGDYRAALELLQPAVKAGEASSHPPSDVYGTATLCHLALGDVKQAAATRHALVSALRSAYDGSELVAELGRLARDPQLPPEALLEIERSAELINAAVAGISEEGLDLDRELDRLHRAVPEDPSDVAAARSALVAMASSRLLLRRGRWEEAAQACLVLLAAGTEGPTCADAILNRLFAAVDTMLRSGARAAALSILRQAMPTIGSGRRREVVIRTILACLADDQAGADQSLASEIQGADGPTVAAVLQVIAPDVETMFRIAARAQQAGLPALDQALLRIAENALRLNPEDDAASAVAPILVEIGNGLYAAEPAADSPLFQTHLPALRERVEKRTGVRLPAVLIRAVPELPPAAFRVSVAGQWPEPGRIEPGMVYVRRPGWQVNAVLGSSCRVLPATDPVTGRESCWVSYERLRFWGRLSAGWKGSPSVPPTKAAWKRFLEDTGTWDDALSYPVVVLERHVISRLSCLVTADDIAATTERWCQEAGIDLDMQVVGSGLGRLTALGHDLLDEGVALIPRPGSGAELEWILDARVPYPQALAAARDIFTTRIQPGAGQ